MSYSDSALKISILGGNIVGLVLELQRDSMDSKVSISDLLRKALVLAKKLELTELQTWIANEMSGYTAGSEIPEFRHVRGQIRVHNPYQGWQPVLIHDTETAKMLASRPVMQPVSELESLLNSSSAGGHLTMPFPPDVERSLMELAGLPLQPLYCVDRSQIHGILEAVRNTVLSSALKLEKEGVLGEGMTFSEDEKKKAQSKTEINIKNFKGILGDVVDSAVNQDFRVQKNDWASLEKFLLSNGLTSEDATELKVAIDTDGEQKGPDKLGENVSGWIGKMTTKAASGAWKVGTGAATGLLIKGLAAFFGWPSA